MSDDRENEKRERMMRSRRTSARIAGQKAPAALPLPPSRNSRPPPARAAPAPPSNHLLQAPHWRKKVGVVALALAIVASELLVLPHHHQPPSRLPQDVAPPCHVRRNPADFAPCALVPDLNLVFAYLTPDLSAGDDLARPWHVLHFFADPALSLHHEDSDAAFDRYLTGRAADDRVRTVPLPPQLRIHRARMHACAVQDRWRASFGLLRLLSPWAPWWAPCDAGEARQQFGLASSVLAAWLAEHSAHRQATAHEELARWQRSVDARVQINAEVQRIADNETYHGDAPQQMTRLAHLRGRYAAWLVEGVRWACRAREYGRAVVLLDAMREEVLRGAEDDSFSRDTLQSTISRALDAVLYVDDGAVTHYHECVVEHVRAALEYCIPLGLGKSFRDADGNVVSLDDGAGATEDGSIPQTCEHILDPTGRGCTTQQQAVWYAWHNLADMAPESSSPSSSTPNDPRIPPHLVHCIPDLANTPSLHWSRHLFPPLTRAERITAEHKSHAVDYQFGLTVKLNPAAAEGKMRHLKPWQGMLRIARGRW